MPEPTVLSALEHIDSDFRDLVRRIELHTRDSSLPPSAARAIAMVKTNIDNARLWCREAADIVRGATPAGDATPPVA